MPLERTKVYLFIICLLLASLVALFLFSAVSAVRIRREIDENHEILQQNFLDHTQSLNRMVFTLHRLLSVDESGKTEEQITAEKEELCRSVVSNARYISELPDLTIDVLFHDDPLLLEESLREHNQVYEILLSDLNRKYESILQANDRETKSDKIASFEETGREMMDFLESKNRIMVDFDSYVFFHLQNDNERIVSILGRFLLVHFILTAALIAVSLLYFSLARRTRQDLVKRSEHLEEVVELRTRDLAEKHELLKTAYAEKEVLLKEVHHRVKNNLALIESILSLHHESAEDPVLRSTCKDISSRIRSIGLVHQKIYQSESLARIDFKDYVTDLADAIIDSFSIQNVSLDVSMAPVQLDIQQSIPLGLILSELLTNAVKYGFKEKEEGTISISLTSDNGRLELKVYNDGHPFPEDVDFRASPSLGLTLVNSLVEQIEGTIDLERGKGTLFTIRFKAHH